MKTKVDCKETTVEEVIVHRTTEMTINLTMSRDEYDALRRVVGVLTARLCGYQPDPEKNRERVISFQYPGDGETPEVVSRTITELAFKAINQLDDALAAGSHEETERSISYP